MKHLFLLIFVIFTHLAWGQQDSFVVTGSKTSVRMATYDLIQAMENGDPDETIAPKYHQLAKELVRQGEFAKAEIYFTSASRLYLKLNNKQQLMKVTQDLEKVREAQYKWGPAFYIKKSMGVRMNKTSTNQIVYPSYARQSNLIPDTIQVVHRKPADTPQTIRVVKNNTPPVKVKNERIDTIQIKQKADSALLADRTFFRVQEKRIAQLEKERILKDELIRKKNQANSILQVALLLILICFFFIIRAWFAIRQKNKRIALQSLRREMNPHFLFNSLNSVNQFIAENDELKANKYLTSYSRLMRNMLDNSNKDFIPLATELEQLKEYLDLEQMRFHDKFTYLIDLDNDLDAESAYIPNMLIQPYLENAIWHGLRYKDGQGTLALTIRRDPSGIRIRIEDNGIGIAKSKQFKTQNQKVHHSRGIANTQERIRLLNSLYHTRITTSITDKEKGETGVIVLLHYPYQQKKTWKKQIRSKA